MHTLAIDIGGTKFSVAAFLDGKIVQRESRKTDREGGKEWMLGQLGEIVRGWQKQMKFDRCGVGFGGPVNFRTQTIARSTHVSGWSDFALAQHIREQFGIPAIIDNDANVGALAEANCGAGRGFDPLVYMTISTGIGGGIVSDGKVLRGFDGSAGEIGHVQIDPNGPPCLCGSNGCLERFCCGLWLERDNGKPAEVLLRDPQFVAGYVKTLARGLRIVTMMVNPARIVIGGGISKAGDRLFVPRREELRRLMSPWPWTTIDVVPSMLSDDNILFGANELAKGL
jgi:glucokinase